MPTRTSGAIFAFLLALTGWLLLHERAAAASQAPITLPSGHDLTRATIPVQINGNHYPCVLDTGTSAMLVSRSVARTAGLATGAPVYEIAPDGRRYADNRTHIARFSAGGYTLHDLPALISSKLTGQSILCGYDFFARVPVLIDRDRMFVTLFPNAAVWKTLHCVPINLSAHVPVATIGINGTSIERIVLDSGMVGGGALWEGLRSRFMQPPVVDSRYSTSALARQGGLACGQSVSVSLFSGAPSDAIELCTETQHPDGYNGIIETNLPTVHQLGIDYPSRRLCFGTSVASVLTGLPQTLDQNAWTRMNQQHPPR